MSLLESNTDALERLMEEVNNLPNPNPNGASVQTDWNQTDETAPDFLKNKPFGESKEVFFAEQEIAFENGEGAITVSALPSVGSNVAVKWDGVEYVCQATEFNGAAFVGNGTILGMDDTGEPFAFMFVNEQMVFAVSIVPEKTTAIVEILGESVNKIDPKYLSIVKKFYLSESDNYLYSDLALTTKATATEVRNAMLNSNPVFTRDEVQFYGIKEVMNTGKFAIVLLFDENKTKKYTSAEYVPD